MRRACKCGLTSIVSVWFLVLGTYMPHYEAFSRTLSVFRGAKPDYRTSTAGADSSILSVTSLAGKRRKAQELNLDECILDGEKLLNGKSCLDNGLEFNLTHAQIRKKDMIPNAPHLTFQKFLTMQEKRVVVSFRFTDIPYLRPYFLTFAGKLKKKHADIIIEKRILPVVDANAQPLFEVLVDGKIAMGGGSHSKERHILGGRVDLDTQSVFVSMEQIGLAITKARNKRRPTTLYGQGADDEDGEDSPTKRWHRSYVLRNGMKPSADD